MRKKYLDALRGAMILFVVFYHLLGKTFKVENSIFYLLFEVSCMEIFFFISGYFAYKNQGIILGSVWELVKNKILELIVPTAIWYTLFQFCNSSNPLVFFQTGPQGYWFTLSLFENFLFYYLFIIIHSKLRLGGVKLLSSLCV